MVGGNDSLSLEDPRRLLRDMTLIARQSEQFLTQGFSADGALTEHGIDQQEGLSARAKAVRDFAERQREIDPSLDVRPHVLKDLWWSLDPKKPKRKEFELALKKLWHDIAAIENTIEVQYTEPLPKAFLREQLKIGRQNLDHKTLSNWIRQGKLRVHKEDHPDIRPRARKIRVRTDDLIDYKIFNPQRRKELLAKFIRRKSR